MKITNQSNYLAKVVELKGLRKHDNADRLQCVSIDFQNVITGLDAKDGDLYVYFPVGCKIHPGFLSHTNSYASKELNEDKEAKGYFNDKGVVKATRLRGEKSFGYLIPIGTLEGYFGFSDLANNVGQEFDTLNDHIVCEKYVVKNSGASLGKNKQSVKRISRLVDGQFRLHIDTDNLRKNAHKIREDDTISITYKLHGTSWVAGNVLVKRKLNTLEKFAKWLGVKVKEDEYDVVYSSRNVVKNQYLKDEKNHQHYYDVDIWEIVKDRYTKDLPKGYTLYGEIVGYLPNGGAIQHGYDYGCGPNMCELYVYRVTSTNVDGLVYELNFLEVQAFCERLGIKTTPLIFFGKAKDAVTNFRDFVPELEAKYNDKDCYLSVNKVPEEGVVVRLEKPFGYEPFKLKSFRFLSLEGDQLDKEVSNIEDEN